MKAPSYVNVYPIVIQSQGTDDQSFISPERALLRLELHCREQDELPTVESRP